VSPFTGVLFANGASFSDGSKSASDAASLEAMYVAHGANEVYARISTEKKKTMAPDDHSEETALVWATLARSLGLPLNPELGLWKHYGDITCEPAPDFSEYPSIMLPGAWSTLSIDQMLPALEAYGTLVATDILATGVTVNFWDLGNEIDFGTAGVEPQGMGCSTPWTAPDGVDPMIGTKTVMQLFLDSEQNRIAWLAARVWPHEARILAAVRAGILAIAPNAKFSTHISQSRSATFALAFYDAMFAGGLKLDQVGFSYYPSSNNDPNRAASFKDTVTKAHAKYGLPVFLAEFAYPAGPIPQGAYMNWTNAIPNYPITEEGQFSILRDIASWGPSAGLSGMRPWAPEVFLPGWQGFALFAAGNPFPATARKGIDGIREGLAHPDPNAFHD
jgi:arabinogalactan endo-1,4-beta-galactosidase